MRTPGVGEGIAVTVTATTVGVVVGVAVSCAGIAVNVAVGVGGVGVAVGVGSAVVAAGVGDGDDGTSDAVGVAVDNSMVGAAVRATAGVAAGAAVGVAAGAVGATVGVAVDVSDGVADGVVSGSASVARITVDCGAERLPPKRAIRMITPVRNASAARINWMLGRCDGSGFMRLFPANCVGQRLYRVSHSVVNASGLARGTLAQHKRTAFPNAIIVVAVADPQDNAVPFDLHLRIDHTGLRAAERSIVPDHRFCADQCDR